MNNKPDDNIEYANIYGAIFYDGAIVTEGTMKMYPRLAVFAPERLRINGPLTIPDEDRERLRETLEGHHRAVPRFAWKIAGPVYVTDSDGTHKFDQLAALCPTDEAPTISHEKAPVEWVRNLLDEPTLEAGGSASAIQMMTDCVMSRARIAKIDAAHGCKPAGGTDGLIELLAAKDDPEQLQAVLAKLGAGKLLGNAPVGGIVPVVQEETQASYVPVTATDFADAALVRNSELVVSKEPLRVASLDTPVWHPMSEAKGTKELVDLGYVGWWEVKTAAIGEKIDLGPLAEGMGFSVVTNLRVLAKSPTSISPAGKLCIPVEVYRALGGTDEPELLTSKQAQSYNAVNGVSVPRPDSRPN